MTEKCELCEEIQKASTDNGTKRPKLTSTGKWILGIMGATFVGISAITTPFLIPALRKVCLPFVPATTKQVQNVMRLLNGQTGRVVDLGSGDGRIVIEAAKHGFLADGVELNPWLVWYSRAKAIKEGVHSNVIFHRKDIFKTDFSRYDHIVIFGVDSMMESLEGTLQKSMPQHCRVIACRFPFKNWTPVKVIEDGIDTVWLYKPSSVKS